MLLHGEDDPDDWVGRFYADAEYPTIVRTTTGTYKMLNRHLIGHDLSAKSPLMRLDIGASLTVAGDKRLQWRNPNRDSLREKNQANFRFRDGPERPSQGACAIRVAPPPDIATRKDDQLLRLKVHIVKESLPLLISWESIAKLQETLNFADPALAYSKPDKNPAAANSIRALGAPLAP